MAERPYVSFDEVKRKISIVEVLEVLGLADRFRPVGSTLTGVCPLPSHTHGPSPNSEQFKINCKEGVWLWHCFGDCQKGGDVVEFVKAMTGYDNAHVRFWFAEKFSDRLTAKKEKRRSTRKSTGAEEAPPKKEEARANPGKDQSQQASPSTPNVSVPPAPPPLKPLRFFLNLDPDVPYLKERGLSPDTIRRFGLGLCTNGFLKGYVAIPVHAHPRQFGTNPIGYLGRWPGDDFDCDGQPGTRPRYKFPNDFPRNQIVYGLSEALESEKDRPLIVVEGPFKLFHLFQSGFSNTVATFGVSLSDEQAELLVATGRSLVLLFDGDQAGIAGMRAAAGKLITRSFVRVVKLGDGVEPDSLSALELQNLLS